jgi:hypothetical protein
VSAVFNTAWLRTDRGHAYICSWCPDAEAAERRAAERHLRVSHTICDECRVRVLSLDAGTAQVAEHSPGAPAQAAAASTPSAGAACVVFLPVQEVSEICGVDGFEIVSKLRPEHWLLGRHYRGLPGAGGFEIAETALPDLVGEFSTAGRKSAALALWRWLVARNEERAAIDGSRADSSAGGRTREISSAAGAADRDVGGWHLKWERAHE